MVEHDEPEHYEHVRSMPNLPLHWERLVLPALPVCRCWWQLAMAYGLTMLHAAMVSFVCPGLLGSSRGFSTDFAVPLSQRHGERCSAQDRQAAEAAEARLQAVLSKCLLRRCCCLACFPMAQHSSGWRMVSREPSREAGQS